MNLNQLKDRLSAIDAKLQRIEPPADSSLDDLQKHFHLGMVGGSGSARNLARLNTRRARSMDKSIDHAKAYVELMRERESLERQIKHIESGAAERDRTTREEIEHRLRDCKPGDKVIDSAYGVVTVVRANNKSLTIVCDSGYKEARPFSLIVGPCA